MRRGSPGLRHFSANSGKSKVVVSLFFIDYRLSFINYCLFFIDYRLFFIDKCLFFIDYLLFFIGSVYSFLFIFNSLLIIIHSFLIFFYPDPDFFYLKLEILKNKTYSLNMTIHNFFNFPFRSALGKTQLLAL